MKNDIRNIILDEDYWHKITKIMKLTEKIANGTDLMQSDTSISTVFYQFSQWEKQFTGDDDLDQFILGKIRERWDLISHECHSAAYCLDPRFRDENIDIHDIEDAEKYLSNIAGEEIWEELIYDQFMEFRTKNGVFASNKWNCKLKDDPLRP